MALDILRVSINHDAVRTYLNKLDDRSEVYSFNVCAWHVSSSGRLVLNRDGSDDDLEIRLNLDGTWTATHVVVVGGKE